MTTPLRGWPPAVFLECMAYKKFFLHGKVEACQIVLVNFDFLTDMDDIYACKK